MAGVRSPQQCKPTIQTSECNKGREGGVHDGELQYLKIKTNIIFRKDR